MRAYLASLTWSTVRSILGGFTGSRHYKGFQDHQSDDIVGRHPLMMKKGTSVAAKNAEVPVRSPFDFLKRGVAGLADKWTEPRLKIRLINQKKDVIVWKHHIIAWKRKFITVKVENNGMETAARSSAKLAFTMIPPKISHLKREYKLRWIGAKQSVQGDDAGSIHITTGLRHLEIVFSDSDEPLAGCWIACAEAFSDTTKDQVFLPAGVYHVVLTVTCENGKGDVRKYRIESPTKWEQLRVVEMK